MTNRDQVRLRYAEGMTPTNIGIDLCMRMSEVGDHLKDWAYVSYTKKEKAVEIILEKDLSVFYNEKSYETFCQRVDDFRKKTEIY